MAAYWGLDTNDSLATDLLIGCMFDQPALESQILDLTTNITLTNEGTPTQPLVDGKLAYQPALTTGIRDTALTFFEQWTPEIPGGQVYPSTMMFGYYLDIAPPYGDQTGLFQIGVNNGTNGINLEITTSGQFRISNRGGSYTVTNPIQIGVAGRVIIRNFLDAAFVQSEIWVDGAYEGEAVATNNSMNNDSTSEIGRIYEGIYGYSYFSPITDAFFWGRKLTDQEVADLFADPTRFLIPPDTGAAAVNAIMFGTNF